MSLDTIYLSLLTNDEAFIPLWILPSSFPGLAAGAFFIQVGVQGPFGVVSLFAYFRSRFLSSKKIPVFLNEISPPAFRGTFTGLTYQIGTVSVDYHSEDNSLIASADGLFCFRSN